MRVFGFLSRRRTYRATIHYLTQRIEELETEAARHKRAAHLYKEKSAAVDEVHQAAWRWLQARIASQETQNPAGPPPIHVLMDAEAALDRAVRAAFMRPGVRGSWGRGVARDWDCWFDPQNGGPREGGCECSGHGRREEECRGCAYRDPSRFTKGGG